MERLHVDSFFTELFPVFGLDYGREPILTAIINNHFVLY